MSLKSLYQRFRAWQLEPVTFKCTSEGEHTCLNCGHVFEGDFCPVCGQRFDVGPARWGSVIKDFMLMRGIGARGALSHLMQMLGRPGYLISDYIKGRRRVSSDPLTVLFFLAIFAILILNLAGKRGADETLMAAGSQGVVGFIVRWMSSHLEWAVIIETALLVFPTWLLFRFSPKHTQHTLPEGIYIQLFMGSLVLLFIVLRALIGKWVAMLIPIYYFIAYRQFFGYGIWGTLWRTLLSIGIIFYFFGVAMMVSTRISKEFWTEHTTWEFLSMFVAFLLLGAGVLFLGYWISKRTARKRI